ncbi:MAG: hypothetical protein WCJ59_00615 [bacterium]
MKVNYQEIENYSYAKYIYELKKLCHVHKVNIDIIGYEDFEKIGQKYPIYRITINPEASKRMCVVAGVQAYEIAGPLSMLDIFSNPHDLFNSHVSYRIYPCINPTSFDLRQRMDDDGVDLNSLTKWSLRDKRYKEVQVFFEDIKNWNMDIFVSLHEDVDLKEFYAYIFEEEPKVIYRKIIERWRNDFGGILKDNKIYGDNVMDGLIINDHDDSFEDYLYTNKIAKIALCTETPGLLSLEERIRMDVDNLRILSDSLRN